MLEFSFEQLLLPSILAMSAYPIRHSMGRFERGEEEEQAYSKIDRTSDYETELIEYYEEKQSNISGTIIGIILFIFIFLSAVFLSEILQDPNIENLSLNELIFIYLFLPIASFWLGHRIHGMYLKRFDFSSFSQTESWKTLGVIILILGFAVIFVSFYFPLMISERAIILMLLSVPFVGFTVNLIYIITTKVKYLIKIKNRYLIRITNSMNDFEYLFIWGISIASNLILVTYTGSQFTNWNTFGFIILLGILLGVLITSAVKSVAKFQIIVPEPRADIAWNDKIEFKITARRAVLKRLNIFLTQKKIKEPDFPLLKANPTQTPEVETFIWTPSKGISGAFYLGAELKGILSSLSRSERKFFLNPVPNILEVKKFFLNAGVQVIKEEHDLLRIDFSLTSFPNYKQVLVLTLDTPIEGSDIEEFYSIVEWFEEEVNQEFSFVITLSENMSGSGTHTQTSYILEKGFHLIPISLGELNQALLDNTEEQLLYRRIQQYIQIENYYEDSMPVKTPEFFFGREKIIEQINRLLKRNQNIGLFGIRKIGKTSLLYGVKPRLEAIYCHLDLQIVFKSASSLYSTIIKEFKISIASKIEVKFILHNTSEIDSVEFVSTINNMIQQLHEQQIKYNFFLILDEIDTLISGEALEKSHNWQVEFLASIRSLAQQNEHFSIIVAGLNPEINRNYDIPSYNMFREIWLTGLDKISTKHLIEGIGHRMHLTYDPEAVSYLYELTNGHPFVLRSLCSLIFENRENQKELITKSDVELARDQFLEEDFYFTQIFKSLKPEFQTTLTRIYQEDSSSEIKTLKSQINELTNMGLLITHNNGETEIAIKLFELWLEIKI